MMYKYVVQMKDGVGNEWNGETTGDSLAEVEADYDWYTERFPHYEIRLIEILRSNRNVV